MGIIWKKSICVLVGVRHIHIYLAYSKGLEECHCGAWIGVDV